MRKLLFLLITVFLVNILFAQKSINYSSQFVDLKTNTGSLYGTLLIPNTVKEKVPVVLIIAGSGPTDRDGNNANFQ